MRADGQREPVNRRQARGALRVGRADDQAEREADYFADRVIGALSGHETAASETNVGATQPRIRRSSVIPDRLGGTAVDAGTHQAITSVSGGRVVDDRIRRAAERTSGRDLGNVRVHRDAVATELSQSLDAEAFTTGSDIFVGETAASPGSPTDDQLLAHELGHVVQGGGGPVSKVQRRERLTPLQPTTARTVRRFGSKTKKKAETAIGKTPQREATPERKEVSADEMAKQFSETKQALEVAKADPLFADMGAQADRGERMLAAIKDKPAMWEQFAPRISDLMRGLLRVRPGTEKEPGWGPLRRRLRIVADEAGLLADRASVAKSKQAAGERYLAQGASGGLQALRSDTRATYFDPAAANKEKAVRVRKAGQEFGMEPAEQAAITVFTAQDYKYINPGTANDPEWMLKQREQHTKKAHAKLNPKDRAEAEKKWMKPRREEGPIHTAFAVSGMSKMPAWKGYAYRADTYTEEDFKKKYKLSRGGAEPKVWTDERTTLVSTSTNRPFVEKFASEEISKMGGRAGYIVITVFELTNARDISSMSHTVAEDEVTTLPGATFAVTDMSRYRNGGLAGQDHIDINKVFVVTSKQIG